MYVKQQVILYFKIRTKSITYNKFIYNNTSYSIGLNEFYSEKFIFNFNSTNNINVTQ